VGITPTAVVAVTEDSIVQEVREAHQPYAAGLNYDLANMLDDIPI
jgi:hypothetical protein